jgi:dTDP-glucose 4,6-dehydratase
MNNLPSLQSEFSFESIAEKDFARLFRHIPLNDLRDRSLFVTGITGFFGRWLLLLFKWLNTTQAAGIKIIALSRNPNDFLNKNPSLKNANWIEWIAGDVQNFSISSISCDFIIHGATDTSAAAGKDAGLLLNTIIKGTENVLTTAKKAQAKRILFISSGAIYGTQSPNVTHIEETTSTAPTPLNIANAYGEGKRVMELLGAIHSHETSADVMTARCFAFVGAGLPLDAHFAIGNFIRDALKSDSILIRGDGTTERSYLYAADLAVWLLRLLVSGKSGEAYNVGSDQSFTMAELAHTVVKTLCPGKPVIIQGKPDPTAARNRYIPSIDKARSQCGLGVWTPLNQAIALTASYRP